MTSLDSFDFNVNIAFLKYHEKDHPHIQWVEWPHGIPLQLQRHIMLDGGGYVCALVDVKTNVFMYKQKHVFEANLLCGGTAGWPPHIPAFHALQAVAKPKVDYMAITRAMCAGR